MRRFFMMYAALLISGAAAFGYTNVLENGTNLTITTGWDAGGNMYIGDATSGNTLTVAAGGSLTNVDAYVGATSNASYNTATVSGSGAGWISTGTLQVGETGNSNNVVSVSSGGAVAAGDLVIHSDNDFNLNRNGVLSLANGIDVSTDGFNWNAGGILSVGGALTGMATNNEGAILAGEKTLVLNGGSLVSATDLIIGYESSGNTFAVTNGATASSAGGYIGWGAGSSDNAVLVSDAGSAWTNSGNLYVGVYGDATNRMTAGAGNSLTVTNEGWVFVGGLDTNLTAMGSGGIAVAGGAEMVVGEGAGVLAEGVYIDAAGTFDLDGTMRVTGDFDAGQAGFNWNDGSTLTVNQQLAFNQDYSGTNKTLNLDGGSWDRGSDFGMDGAGNTLAIRNGGEMINDTGVITGTNNTVEVLGAGSHWLNNGALNITDSGNRVTVGSGGKVTADSLSIHDGNGFDLINDGTLAMTGDFDLSVQTNLNWNIGGNLSVGGAFSGLTNLTDGRVLTLDGSGATWDLAHTNIGIGNAGFLGTTLTATNGATVKAANVYVQGSANIVNVESDSWLLVGDGADAGALVDGGAMVASTNGALLSVDDSTSVHIAGALLVGAGSTATGTVSVAVGSTVTAGGLSVFDVNSTFDLFGTLSVTTNFNAGQDGFTWHDGASLSVEGILTGLDTLGGSNRTLVIDGGGTWDTTAADLYITGVDNTFAVTNGGQVDSASAYIGITSNDVGNTALVEGPGSAWNLTGDLFISPGNTLELASTGLVTIAGDMSVSNAAVAGSGSVVFGAGANVLGIYGTNSQISANVLFDGGGGEDVLAVTESELTVAGSLSNRFAGFENLNMTNSLLGGSGVVDVFDNINLSGGWISVDGELVIDGLFTASDTILQLTAGADSLRFTNSGAQDLSGLMAEVTISNSAAPAGFNEQILTSADGLSGPFASTNFIESFLLYDFLLTNDTTTVSVMSEAVQDGEIGATMAYSGIQGVRASFNGMQNALFVRTKQLRRNAVATDYAISNEAYLMSDTNAPAGPLGPGDRNTIFGMHFWAEQFSGQGDYDAMGPAGEGFVLNNNGTTFGFDRLFGDSLVAGINYTYARTAARMDSGDRMDTETYWLGLYGEWFGKNDYYLEGLIGLGWSDYNTTRFDVGYEGVGNFEGSDVGGHIEAGKYFHRNNWALAPYAGLHYLGIKSDAYTESHQAAGPPVTVSEQDVASFESALGIKLRNRFDTRIGRFQTVGYAEWVYDFINDEIGSTLSDGTISVETARITPDAGLINAGVGISWICTDYLEVGAGYDGRFNENYEEHMGSAMLEVRF